RRKISAGLVRELRLEKPPARRGEMANTGRRARSAAKAKRRFSFGDRETFQRSAREKHRHRGEAAHAAILHPPWPARRSKSSRRDVPDSQAAFYAGFVGWALPTNSNGGPCPPYASV